MAMLPVISPRIPIRDATAPTMSMAGISANAETPARRATSEGRPPSSRIRRGR